MLKVGLIVDNPFRDLPGLVLLALYLCKYNATCYLIPSNLRRSEIGQIVPDFILFNYLRVNNQIDIKSALDAGICIGVLDTEGGIITSFDDYGKTIAPDAEIRQAISLYCAWGKKTAEEIIKRAWYLPDQVIVTGNPRFDYYAQPLRQASLRSEYKPYILVNSNFTLANPAFKTPEQEMAMYIKTFGYSHEYMAKWLDSNKKSLEMLVEMTNKLAKNFPEINFIYRPHPFEGTEIYKDMLTDRSNVMLIKEGTVDRWIINASAVIQKGCSTGIEAAMVGVPNLSPEWLPVFRQMSAIDETSITCNNEQELIKHVADIVADKFTIPPAVKEKIDACIQDWFFKIDGRSYSRVGDAILKVSKGKQQVNIKAFENSLIRNNKDLKAKASWCIKKVFRIPADKSLQFWNKKQVQNKWENSNKFFDKNSVKVTIRKINAGRNGNLLPDNVHVISLNDELHLPENRSRTVVLKT